MLCSRLDMFEHNRCNCARKLQASSKQAITTAMPACAMPACEMPACAKPGMCNPSMCCVCRPTVVQSKSNQQAASKTEALKRTAAAQDVRRNTLENSEDFDARVCLTCLSLTTKTTCFAAGPCCNSLHGFAWGKSALSCAATGC